MVSSPLRCGAAMAIVMSTLPAQGTGSSPCAPLASRLQIGVASPSGWNYLEPLAPVTLTEGKLRFFNPTGSWSTLGMRTFVDDPMNPLNPSLLQLWNQYPWLRPPVPVPAAALCPGWAGQDPLHLEGGLFWLLVFGSVIDPILQTVDPGGVKHWYQPTLGSPGAVGFREWAADASIWLSNYLGYGVGPLLSQIWSGSAVDVTQDPRVFDFEAIARVGIFLQSPAQAYAFLTGPNYTLAKQVGLHVTIQGFSARSADPGFVPSLIEHPGMPGLQGFPGFFPLSGLTNPVTIHVPPGAPTGPGGPPPQFGATLGIGIQVTFRCRDALSQMVATFTPVSPLVPPPAVPLVIDPEILDPLRVHLTIPPGAGDGPIAVANGLGLTNPAFATLDVP